MIDEAGDEGAGLLVQLDELDAHAGGLVTLGGLQGWWIAPVLGSLDALPLAVASTVLTAFNDNAAITYLSTLVPGLTDTMKHAVVAKKAKSQACSTSTP